MKTLSSFAVIVLLLTGIVAAQERVTSGKSRGGKPLGEPWENMPADLRHMQYPNGPFLLIWSDGGESIATIHGRTCWDVWATCRSLPLAGRTTWTARPAVSL
jgi:hypothetical protein